MSKENPFRLFRPISFDDREPSAFFKPGQAAQLDPNILKPVPTSPTHRTSMKEPMLLSAVQGEHVSSRLNSLDACKARSDIQEQESKKSITTQKVTRQANLSMAIKGGTKEAITTAPRKDNYADGRGVNPSSNSESHRDNEKAGRVDSFIALSDEDSGLLERARNLDTARPVGGSYRPCEPTQLPSLNQQTSAPLSSFSSFSEHAGPATVTSINTTTSISSCRDSEIVKPIPCHARSSNVKGSSQIKEEGPQTSQKPSPAAPELTEKKNISGEAGSRSSSGSIGTLFGDRKLSETKGSRFRKLVSTSRQRPGTEPWGISKKNTISSSSSSSTTEVDEMTGVANRTSFERKSSKGHSRASGRLGALRMKKTMSRAVDDDDGNPWFQERSLDSFARQESETNDAPQRWKSSDDLTSKKNEVLKKKKLKYIGRHIFGREKEDKDVSLTEKHEARDSLSPDSTTPLSLPNKGSRQEDSESFVGRSILENIRLEKDVRKAISAKQGLIKVLDTVLALREKPMEDVQNIFFKYLSSNLAIEMGIRLILDGVIISATNGSGRNSFTESTEHQTHRELLIYAYLTGPSRLRKAVLNHSKARSQLLAFLGGSEISVNSVSDSHAFKVNFLAKLLNGVLLENPSSVIELVSGNPGFLCSFAKNHVHVPEVVDFVCQLCAANALSGNAGDEFRYGAPNAAGIILLAKEGICDVLVRIFEESCNHNSNSALRWQVQVMSTKCLLELSKRSVVVLKFSKSNCSYSSKYIKSLNEALGVMNSFENVDRVSRVLQVGLDCVENDSFPQEAENANAAVCALSLVKELLDLVSSARDSKSVVARRTVGTINTKGLEELIVAKTGVLCKILEEERTANARGRLKVEIVKVFRSLFGSRSEESRMALADSVVPRSLLGAIRANKLGSILHGCVVECIATSLKRESSGRLHKAWIRAIAEVGIMKEMVNTLGTKSNEVQDKEGLWSTYESTVVDIGFVLCMFSQNLTRGEFRGLFESEEQYQTFVGKIEPGLGKIEESRRGACGGPKPEGAVVSVLANADALAARINDVNAV